MAAVVYPSPCRPRAAWPDLRLVPDGRPRRPLPPVAPRTYARRRAGVVLVLVALVLAARMVLGTLGGGPLTAPEPASTRAPVPIADRVLVVQPGDTLWSIARRLDPHGDVRVIVQRLAASRHGSVLRAGERLVLPVDTPS